MHRTHICEFAFCNAHFSHWSTLGLGLSKKQIEPECTEKEIISAHSSLAVGHDGEPEYQAVVKGAKKN